MIGRKIYEARKLKGLSQEELAEQSKLSVRTLQRIENDASIPRGKTLNLLCDVLNLKIEDISTEPVPASSDYGATFINYFFLAILNVLIMCVIGFLTLDVSATFNSNFGAVLLGFFIAYFIVTKTPKLTGALRLLKYGTGLMAYLIVATSTHYFPPDLLLGFYPSIAIFLSVLFYGKYLIASK